jgi:hypothetical protein
MTIEGTFRGGVVVLDDAADLLEGTRVQVVVPAHSERPDVAEVAHPLRGLLKFAGTANDLPADFAEQHDHYIHGTPRR